MTIEISKTINANVCRQRALIMFDPSKLWSGARDLKCIVFMHTDCIMNIDFMCTHTHTHEE